MIAFDDKARAHLQGNFAAYPIRIMDRLGNGFDNLHFASGLGEENYRRQLVCRELAHHHATDAWTNLHRQRHRLPPRFERGKPYSTYTSTDIAF
jgi:hypothetical protein